MLRFWQLSAFACECCCCFSQFRIAVCWLLYALAFKLCHVCWFVFTLFGMLLLLAYTYVVTCSGGCCYSCLHDFYSYSCRHCLPAGFPARCPIRFLSAVLTAVLSALISYFLIDSLSAFQTYLVFVVTCAVLSLSCLSAVLYAFLSAFLSAVLSSVLSTSARNNVRFPVRVHVRCPVLYAFLVRFLVRWPVCYPAHYPVR